MKIVKYKVETTTECKVYDLSIMSDLCEVSQRSISGVKLEPSSYMLRIL